MVPQINYKIECGNEIYHHSDLEFPYFFQILKQTSCNLIEYLEEVGFQYT